MFESAPTLGPVNVNMDFGEIPVDSWTHFFGRQTCTAQVRYLEIKKSKSWSKDFPDKRSTIALQTAYYFGHPDTNIPLLRSPPPPTIRTPHYYGHRKPTRLYNHTESTETPLLWSVIPMIRTPRYLSVTPIIRTPHYYGHHNPTRYYNHTYIILNGNILSQFCSPAWRFCM